MRLLLKFLHTLAGAGLTGALAAMAIVLALAPGLRAGADNLPVLLALSEIAVWILAPSLVLTILTGLLAMILTRGFQDAGWVWLKAATGFLMLEGGLQVIGPFQEGAKRVGALAASDPASAARLFEAQANTLWVLLGVAIANIALGVWRPRFKYPV